MQQFRRGITAGKLQRHSAVSGDIIGKKTDWFSRQESETVPDTSQNSDSKQRRGN